MNNKHLATILVIDPDSLALTAISATLHAAGYSVSIAQDANAALQAAQTELLDLVICDERVDDSDGVETIMSIRSQKNCWDIPIMYLSRHQAVDVIHRSHDFGAAYHLRKPVDPQALLDLVDTALWQLPLINEQVRQQKLRQPHFAIPVARVVDQPAGALL
ncbi:MAG TPA: response regulator [Pirellulaceae bacterium]|nr:response regulator [Pirellulaceae bacterium]HMO91708.1 response regulator [Pirellulaceae bacterium]HMP68404.1 response regulator [Pirellulaceae bacterium]